MRYLNEPLWLLIKSICLLAGGCLLLFGLHDARLLDHLSKQSKGSHDVEAAEFSLECVQLAPPITVPAHIGCQQVLITQSFANSYGAPFVGKSTRRRAS
jgi:hypothetical protein